MNKGLGLAVAVLATGVLLNGCGGGHSNGGPLDQADSAFISSVLDAAPDIGTYRSDTQLIRLGHAACDGFASGVSYEQLADQLTLQEGSNPLPSEDLGAVITAAVESLCPKYLSQVS